jgi:phospholipid-translocating P-type ATPase (flippase)
MGAYFFGQTPGWTQSEMWEYQQTMDHIQEYATTGLRTLLYGHRFLSKEEYSLWSKKYVDAQSALEGRQDKLEQVAELLEQNLDMTGATAIEDKLQDGVPETIDKLRRAGIRLWMLTGDKRETAINIGYSCRLIKDYSSTIILDVPTQAQAHKAMNKAMKDVMKGKSRHVVVVIDGATLGIVEQSTELMALFVELGIRADSVICCRVSPAQKALVVKTVRARCKNTVTLAIGDGANDIAMIQEANVGIGITGKEGLQAARSSDYSIAQFRFLERLLFVHGRWSYVRVSKFVLGTFYKCATFYLTQGLFQIFTGFSGTSLYEQWTLSFYNTLFSSLPVMVVGMFEQDLKASTLLLVPELYTFGPRNSGFSLVTYGTWMAAAVYQAIACLMVPLWIAGAIGKFGVEPDDESLFSMGLGVYTTIVLVVTFKIAYLETHNWSIVTHLTSFLTILAWFGYNTVYSFFYPVRTGGYHVRGAFQSLAAHLPFWLTIIVASMIAILPNIMAKIIKAQLYPSDVDLYQELEKDPDAVQRWKEWEVELGNQGAEAEGVTGSKIQRRLSIAASIVSRHSSRRAPSLSSRRGRSKSQQALDANRNDSFLAVGRHSQDARRESFGEGQDQVGDLWGPVSHRRGASSASQMARDRSRANSASPRDAKDSGPWSATQLHFPRPLPIPADSDTSVSSVTPLQLGVRRSSSAGHAHGRRMV